MHDMTIRDAAASTSDPESLRGGSGETAGSGASGENSTPEVADQSFSDTPSPASAIPQTPENPNSPGPSQGGNVPSSLSRGSVSAPVIPIGSGRPTHNFEEMRAAGWDGVMRLVWLMAILGLMVGIRYGVPQFAEEVQYSITRGRERAQFEQAGRELQDTPLAAMSRAYQMVSKRVSPSVVHINVTSTSRPVSDESLGPMFPSPRRRESSGQGSGVIVDSAGYIVTNYHVIRDATEIEVGLSDGRRLGAQLVGTDPATDLALLRIDADRLTAAEWGDSERLEVGSLVWAAGSPFGLQRTITFGILSAKNRAGVAGNAYQDFLQTDAAVNPGNSGGPLVDEQGRVVGINTAIVGEVYQGISFAVPSNVVREVYERLRLEGKFARGWLGVEMDEVTDELADRLGLNVPQGAYVVKLVDIIGNSPARSAGIKSGDVIVRWNDNDIVNPATLTRLVGKTQIGSEARVVVVRAGNQLELNVAVGERPTLD
jgi:serine protease Do